MKAIYLHAVGALALSFTIAACIPQVDPIVSTPEPVATPAPSPTPVPTPTRTPTPTPTPVVQEPEFANYLDAPQTPGTWRYQDFGPGAGKRALFSDPADEFYFSLSCVTQPNGPEILFTRTGTPRAARLVMTIQTETTRRSLSAQRASASLIAATVPASDPLLDAMAITKGRFAVEVEGERTLYIPAWVEVSRVIEDCR